MRVQPPQTESCDEELRLFETRVRRYQGPLFAYLGRLGLNRTLCEDVAQETCLRAWRHRASFDADRGAYATWLFRIARNLAFNQIRRASRTVEQVDSERVLQAESGGRASDCLEQEQLALRIDRTLQRLSPEDREVLALACIDELSSSQAAAVVQCSPGTFRTRLSRARQRFTDQWEEESS